MHALTGYADSWSVKQSDPIRFMISSAGGRDFAVRIVRHSCADPNSAGPGYAEIPMASAIDGTHAGKEQRAYLGSFGHVASLPVDLRGGVCLSSTIWPTTPGKGRQGLVALRIDGWTLALGIARARPRDLSRKRPGAVRGIGDGGVARPAAIESEAVGS